MNVFDKLCAMSGFVLGLVFLVLGVLGLFNGCQANFSLPPGAGVLPAFIGWGDRSGGVLRLEPARRSGWIGWVRNTFRVRRPAPPCSRRASLV